MIGRFLEVIGFFALAGLVLFSGVIVGAGYMANQVEEICAGRRSLDDFWRKRGLRGSGE